MTKTLNLLTKNKFKVATAELALGPLGFSVIPLEYEIPEIQADTNIEIARHSAVNAAKELNIPVVREDHGFFLHAFPGWPGPYMAHTERIIPPQDLLLMLDGKDRTGYFSIDLAYAEPNKQVIEYSFQIPVQITADIRPGDKDFGWDPIIILGDDPRAISEYPPEERYPFFTENFIKLAQDLS